MHLLARIAFVVVSFTASFVALGDEWDRFHPDQHQRERGFEAWKRGDKATAIRHFEQAAKYADKPSQLALALAHWGDEAAPNRPLGYAWADVAAERGYPDFLAVRERYWNALDEAEQAEARRIGAALAEEYGDAKAKKRLERLLRQGLSKKTGSRTGSGVSSVSTGALDASGRANMLAAISTSGLNNILTDNPDINVGGSPAMDTAEAAAMQAANQMSLLSGVSGEVTRKSGVNYYSDANWKPKAYWAYQDSMWMELDGVVEVKEIKRRPRSEGDPD